MSRPARAPSFCVVVPTHRWSEQLEICLTGIAALDPAPDQVLVVLDGCTLPPGPLLGDLDLDWQAVRMTENRGPAAARNCGAELAQTSHLVFLDSDVVPAPDILARFRGHLEAASDDPPAAVIGSYDDRPSDRGLPSSYRNLLHHWTHQLGNRRAFTFWGACGMVSREAFERVGGFDEGYRRPSIEDIELGYRLRQAGERIVLDPQIQIRHLKHWSVGGILVTDLRDRAIPWTRLLLRAGKLPDDLNLRFDQRLSALLTLGAVAALPASLIGGPGLLVALPLAAGALIVLNLPFYRFLLERRGLAFTLGALPLHWLYFLIGGVGFGLGALAELWDRLRGRSSGRHDAPERVGRGDGDRLEARPDVALCPPPADQDVPDSLPG